MFAFNTDFFGKNLVWWIGVCEDNSDPIRVGRIKARAFGWHTEKKTELPTDDLPWAYVLQPPQGASNSGMGLNAVIQPGTWVMGFWADGDDAQVPVVIGCFPGTHRPNPTGYGNDEGRTGGPSGTPGAGAGQNNSGGHVGQSLSDPSRGATTLPNAATHGQLADSDDYLTNSSFPGGGRGPLKYYTAARAAAGGLACNGTGQLRIHKPTVMALEALCDKMGRKLNINSAYRSPQYNARIGGARGSQHIQGRAFDVSKASIGNIDQFLKAAIEVGFVSFGHYNSFIHIDTRRAGGTAWVGSGTTKEAWVARLRRAGWSWGMRPRLRGGASITNTPPIAPPRTTPGTTPTTGPEANIDPIAAGLPTQTNYYHLGFRDPTNSWPLNAYRGQPSTNFLARGVTDQQNSFQVPSGQESARAGGFPIAGGGGTWSAPPAAHAAQYPHNMVLSSRSGSLELDDSPGASRVALSHTSGTHMEIDKTGTKVDAVAGDAYQTVNQNAYQGVQGNLYQTVMGTWNMMAQGEVNIQATSDMQITSHNDINSTAHGDVKFVAGDRVKIKAKKIILEAEEVHFTSTKEMMFEAKEGFNFKGKFIKAKLDADVGIQAATVNVKTSGNSNIEASTINLKAGSVKADNVTAGAAGATVTDPKDTIDLDDLGSPAGLTRAQIQERPEHDSTRNVRPNFRDMQGAQAGGIGSGAQPDSGDFNIPGAARPGQTQSTVGGSEGEGHTESRGVGIDGGSGNSQNMDQSLNSSEGVQNYVNQVYPRFYNGNKVGKPSQDFVDGVNQACRETGFPNGLAFLIAAYESGFRNVGTSTSSANGYFQMTTGAMTTASQFASRNGLNASGLSSGGGVSGQMKAMIYNLYAGKPTVERSIGRQVKVGEMYLIHFQGPGGAIKVIKGARDTPDQQINLPNAAGNRAEYYHGRRGVLRTWKEFYDRQMGKFEPAGSWNTMVPASLTQRGQGAPSPESLLPNTPNANTVAF